MNGKGDKRRPGKPGAYEEGYQSINWGSRKAEPKKWTAEQVLTEDYNRPVEWVIPSIEELLERSTVIDSKKDSPVDRFLQEQAARLKSDLTTNMDKAATG